MKLLSYALPLVLLAAALPARAAIETSEMTVPVEVTNIYGKKIAQNIHVGVFVEANSPQPRPLVVLNHGRSANPEGFARTDVKDYAAAARWLTRFGFVVAVPIRVGYGRSGGEDVEYSGPCASRNYPPIYQAAADQTLAVLAALRKRPDAAQDRAVVMGQSFGGTTAITLASLNPPGVQGAVNFAGGGGGRPDTNPEQPCSPAAMRKTFEGYGKSAKIPTLWLYSENDRYWGPQLPREWFDAFRAAGGKGEFIGFPPVSDDGHRTFSRAPQLWQPKVREFLETLGYKAP